MEEGKLIESDQLYFSCFANSFSITNVHTLPLWPLFLAPELVTLGWPQEVTP